MMKIKRYSADQAMQILDVLHLTSVKTARTPSVGGSRSDRGMVAKERK
jgi:hypothetical protein